MESDGTGNSPGHTPKGPKMKKITTATHDIRAACGVDGETIFLECCGLGDFFSHTVYRSPDDN